MNRTPEEIRKDMRTVESLEISPQRNYQLAQLASELLDALNRSKT